MLQPFVSPSVIQRFQPPPPPVADLILPVRVKEVGGRAPVTLSIGDDLREAKNSWCFLVENHRMKRWI